MAFEERVEELGLAVVFFFFNKDQNYTCQKGIAVKEHACAKVCN